MICSLARECNPVVLGSAVVSPAAALRHRAAPRVLRAARRRNDAPLLVTANYFLHIDAPGNGPVTIHEESNHSETACLNNAPVTPLSDTYIIVTRSRYFYIFHHMCSKITMKNDLACLSIRFLETKIMKIGH